MPLKNLIPVVPPYLFRHWIHLGTWISKSSGKRVSFLFSWTTWKKKKMLFWVDYCQEERRSSNQSQVRIPTTWRMAKILTMSSPRSRSSRTSTWSFSIYGLGVAKEDSTLRTGWGNSLLTEKSRDAARSTSIVCAGLCVSVQGDSLHVPRSYYYEDMAHS